MLVLHGFWSASNGLCLWAEDSDLTVKSPSQALRAARPHPFAAPADVIASIHAGKPGTAVLLLPSLRMAPLDSPELFRITPRPVSRTNPALLPWTVPVVCTNAASAITSLNEPATDVRYGASVAYLADLAAFARELVERGRILPACAHDGHGPVALWRPVLQGPDIVAMNSLIGGMPPVCRAEPGAHDAHELATSALHAFVDAAVRAALPAGTDLLPPRRGRRSKRLSATEAWLTALTAPDGRFEADPGEFDPLVEALRPWDEIGLDKPGPARATFRLTENETDPDAEEAPGWRLEFLLQSMADPSLLVPAEQAWHDDGALRRWLDRPQELLLAELGRAARTYPELAAALRTARPSELCLDTDGAYHFLSIAAPLLDEAGFGVLLPSWWDRRRKLGLALSAYTPIEGVVGKKSRFGRDQLVDFRWELAVGDDTLTEDEIAALAETKAPLIRLRGQWVAVDPEQLDGGLEFLAREPTGQATAAEILALAARHPDDADAPLAVTTVRADGWLGDLLSGAAVESLQPCRAPARVHREAAPVPGARAVLAGVPVLARAGRCLADDMGLGKTVQLLAMESLQRHQDPDTGPTLLLCPMSLVGNWQREAARFAPDLRVYAHHGGTRLRGDELREHLADTDLVVTTYATATRDIDELSGRRVEPGGARRGAGGEEQLVPGGQGGAAAGGGHRVALTGTPVENRLAELWSVMDFLNPGLLGSSELFRTRYAIPVERHGQTEPAERLRAITRPYILRRLKTDPTIIDDLPEKIEIKQYCRLTTEQASLYQSIVDDMLEKIENTEGNRAARQRARRDGEAQAGLQPSGTTAARPVADRRAVRARSYGSRRSWRRFSPRGTGCCASPSSPNSPRCWCRTWLRASVRTCCICTVAPRGNGATRWWRASSPVTVRQSSCCR